jgi:hypothetical protein
MSNVIPFHDPQAGPQGDELEAAEAIARMHAFDAVAEGLNHGLLLLSRTRGCERLGVDSLMPIFTAMVRAQLSGTGPE